MANIRIEVLTSEVPSKKYYKEGQHLSFPLLGSAMHGATHCGVLLDHIKLVFLNDTEDEWYVDFPYSGTSINISNVQCVARGVSFVHFDSADKVDAAGARYVRLTFKNPKAAGADVEWTIGGDIGTPPAQLKITVKREDQGDSNCVPLPDCPPPT